MIFTKYNFSLSRPVVFLLPRVACLRHQRLWAPTHMLLLCDGLVARDSRPDGDASVGFPGSCFRHTMSRVWSAGLRCAEAVCEKVIRRLGVWSAKTDVRFVDTNIVGI